MQDPSHGVSAQLQGHVHLVSSHRFPLLPQLNIEQAYRYLSDAPTIVKQSAPMAWNYLNAPPDGTVFLEWIPRNTNLQRFASDGYVWADPEQAFQQEVAGYTIEFLVHAVGFRPGFDQFASHARTRFHYIAKNPQVNAPQPDPSLWIVHYHQTDQNKIIDARQVPVPPMQRNIIQERKWLESQGRLERKEFMLHDREHWPQITIPGSFVPSGQHAHMYSQQQMLQQQQQQQRQAFPNHPNYASQQPPAKRPRHSGPSGAAEGQPDTSIEDEESNSLGDYFDVLTPREISAARFAQHHRWMEEVFSSPYASSRIVPPDLGLGLMGELKGLTEGLLEPPTMHELERATKATESQPFSNLKEEQVEEFSKRVEKHLEEGRKEIERLKQEHAERMTGWKKTKKVMEAEKRLRLATWEGHENAVPAIWRLEAPSGVEDSAANKESVENVVKDVESIIGFKIEGYKEVTLIEKGGLVKEEPRPQQQTTDDVVMDGSDPEDKEMMDLTQQQQQQQQQPNQDTMMSGAIPTPSNYAQQHPLATDSKPPQSTTPQPLPGTYQAAPSQSIYNNTALLQPGFSPADGDVDDTADLLDLGDEDALLDDGGMGMDVGADDIDFIEHSPQMGMDEGDGVTPATLGGGLGTPAAGGFGESVATPVPAITTAAVETTQESANASAVATPLPNPPSQPAEDPAPVAAPEPVAPDTTAEAAALPTTAEVEQAPTDPAPNTALEPEVENAGEAGIFDDGTFDDLAGMDDGGADVDADDGLVDFGDSMGDFGDEMEGLAGGEDVGAGGLGVQDGQGTGTPGMEGS